VTISQDDKRLLAAAEVERERHADWRPLLGQLVARFETGDFATGARLVAALTEAAEAADHHPDVDLRYPHVEVRLSSHDVGGLTMRDVRLAAEISDLAAGMGVTAAGPEALQAVEWALDTWDLDEVRPFWAAVLGLDDPGEGDEATDPGGRWPALWLQGTERPDPSAGTPAQRWHADVRIAPEVVEQRMAAAIAAGGRLVTDEYAPAFWVLADPQGNQACLTTWQGRDAE